jgi:excisionase family DNA binding protein
VTLEETIQAAVAREIDRALVELRRLLAELPAKDSYLPVRDAAKLAAVHPDTIRAWMKAGQLPAHYAGRELRVKLKELEAFMRTGGGTKGERPSIEDEAAQALARIRR